MARALLLLVLIATTAEADVLAIGKPAVELDVAVDPAGKPFKLASFRGRWVVITIGAAWCGPCKEELTWWDRLAGEVAGRATFIALDIDDNIADGKKFHADLGLVHTVRAYMADDKSQVAGTYAIKMPTTVIIGPDGIVRYIHPGFDKALAQREYETLRDALAKLLPAAKPKPPAPKPPPKPVATSVLKPAPVSPVPALLRPDHPHASLWADHWPALPF